MKRIVSIALSVLALVSCGNKSSVTVPATVPELNNQVDSLSWAYGQNIASILSTGFFQQLDADLILRSALYTLHGGTDQPMDSVATLEAIEFVTTTYNNSIKQMAASDKQRVEQEQERYFQQLAKEKPNVQRHSSGFYYEVVKQGSGPNAKYGQRVEFDYRSYFMFSGEPYDQTYGKRQPIIHVVAEPMFRGLIEALQVMNAGSIYRFYFPYDLAFGANGSGGIPPYTPFIYEVELHHVL
ncbi:MAG: FKBP-type peptidyl-prolyl cis-trans isomerase [Bacteroidales bacterium]|nr:FKBP-type peptidyl-prolyl cis-trans isomerase [Bacteroidales bacterium]